MKRQMRGPQPTPGAHDSTCPQQGQPGAKLGRRASRSVAVSLVSLTLIATGGIASPAISVAPQTAPAVAPASLKDDVEAAKVKLTQATKAVDAAEKRVDDAQGKLPAANDALAKAEAKFAQAQAAAEAAAEQVRLAEAEVAAQKVKVAEARERMEALKQKIAGIARQNYINGNESVELSLLLDAQDAADFAAQMEAIRRTARGNDAVFEQLTTLQAALADTLATLKDLEQQAQDQAAIASERRNDANNARNSAAAAKAEIARLIEVSKNSLAESLRLRGEVKRQYEALQAKLMAASGIARTKGTGRNAQQALAWAMKWVGGGSHYDGLCLGFVDDAYDPAGGRLPTAIAQWYRAKRVGVAHPGDRTPPVGAQMFWWSPNAARHIAMYAGGGMVITTGAYGGRVGLRTIEDMDSWGPYLGWADAYYD
ncbi:MAG: hypothetical protein WC054_08765 [Candidatus Nanopelagicales bacterium]